VGIDLPGEAEGELKRPVEWSGTTLNTMAYGYEVAATPLQIAAAYAAVANGGVLMRPFIVKRIVDSRNGTVEETAAQEVRRVISKGTARELTAILESVVEHGTGVSAHVPGLRIAGKTGTSRKFAKGKYEPGNYTASFVGFFPADDPKVVCLVMLDNPKAGGYTGGLASAPIFRNIAEKVYGLPERFMRKAPAVLAAHGRFAMPDVSAVTVEAAKEILADRGVRVDIRGNGPLVLQQHPGPGATVSGNEKVVLDTQDQDSAVPEGYALVPNVLHLAVRRAVSRLALQQLDAGVRGSGLVVAQSPKPGERVKIGTRVLLRCEPRQMSAVAQWF
jgi:cell division protein FtsI (penicillin-binding protein 3)